MAEWVTRRGPSHPIVRTSSDGGVRWDAYQPTGVRDDEECACQSPNGFTRVCVCRGRSRAPTAEERIAARIQAEQDAAADRMDAVRRAATQAPRLTANQRLARRLARRDGEVCKLCGRERPEEEDGPPPEKPPPSEDRCPSCQQLLDRGGRAAVDAKLHGLMIDSRDRLTANERVALRRLSR